VARIDFKSQRLLVEPDLAAGTVVPLDRAQAHYLVNVLRFVDGDAVLVFNGRDGEWRARLAATGRKTAELRIAEQTRAQPSASPLHYCFAPLKHARLDYLVQKAVEMGAGVLQPVITRHTQASRLNMERMRANMVEAAEQCGVLSLPALEAERRFGDWLAAWPSRRLLVFCDEEAENPALPALSALRGKAREIGVLIGPEGGFSEEERAGLLALPHVVRLSLGPRILRADTAAVAALALVQAVLGDWTEPARQGSAGPPSGVAGLR
jgi:16S rRNA (uracil1498-N3)-methyltransferase